MPPASTRKSPEPDPPLSAAVFSILLALADGEKHGYGIMKQVTEPEGGGVAMGPGTLYGSLDRMLRDGLVKESDTSDDERRRYYRLTKEGRRVLVAEAARLAKMLRGARAKSFGREAEV